MVLVLVLINFALIDRNMIVAGSDFLGNYRTYPEEQTHYSEARSYGMQANVNRN
jgi:hypothetical protein